MKYVTYLNSIKCDLYLSFPIFFQKHIKKKFCDLLKETIEPNIRNKVTKELCEVHKITDFKANLLQVPCHLYIGNLHLPPSRSSGPPNWLGLVSTMGWRGVPWAGCAHQKAPLIGWRRGWGELTNRSPSWAGGWACDWLHQLEWIHGTYKCTYKLN